MLCPWRDLAIGDGPPIHTSVTETEAAELSRLAEGRVVLEVGAAYGFSTVTLALTARHVTSIDPHVWLGSLGTLQTNLVRYRVVERVTVLADSSNFWMSSLADQGQTFDLAFVDGDHEEAAVAHDVGWARKLLAPGGVLACHDYGEDTCPGVKGALDRLLGPPPKLVDTLAIYEGLA